MRDVNEIDLYFSHKKIPCFIWTMRDVNLQEGVIPDGQNLCFIWTMRDVNKHKIYVEVFGGSVLSELWGM